MPAPLDAIVKAIEAIAPLRFAEPWDNVGLIVAPARPRRVDRALLCIDMTAEVVAEAARKHARLVVAYHPPLFHAVKRLDGEQPAARALAHGIAVYSPHTALDAAPGGVNDWLADGLGRGERAAIDLRAEQSDAEQCKLVVFTPHDAADRLRAALAEAGAGQIGGYAQCSYNLAGFGTFRGGRTTHPAVGRRGRLEHADELRIEMVCPRRALPAIARAIAAHHPYEEPAWDLYTLQPKPTDRIGQGRRVTLSEPVTLAMLVARIKRQLGLKHVRVADAAGRRHVRTIALCAGAGGSVLTGQEADVYWTGEMRHHDVLAARQRGTSVVLCDHTNTERPYLKVLRTRLREMLGDAVAFDLSTRDREPLAIT